jgi:signal transduction histidine kinase
MQTEIEVSLRDPKLTKEETRELLESNLEEVGKLRVLSDSLLRLAQGNGKDLELKPVALDGVAEEAIARFAKAAKAKSIKVHNQVKASEVMGDHESLVEVMAILLDNAIKYSDKQTSITLSSETHGKYGLLSVKDEGQGLKASDIPHIFERFYRADTSRSKQRVEGYGLGLSIAKQIAAAHKGEIEVESAPGKGSTFTVKVPLTNT